MENASIRIIDDEENLREIWGTLSPQKTLYDDFDFRLCFYKSWSPRPPLFCYAVFDADGKAIGLFPLQKNIKKGFLEFFGGQFMEYNKIFVADGYEAITRFLFEAVTLPKNLECMIGDGILTRDLAPVDFGYFLILQDIFSVEDYSRIYDRGKLLKNLRRFGKKWNPEIKIGKEGLNELICFSEKRFGRDSWFADAEIGVAFRNLLMSSFDARMLSVSINGAIEAAAFSVLYKNIYYYLLGGSNHKEFPDIGNLLIMEVIKDAIVSGAEMIDAGFGDMNWKEYWRFSKIPEYEIYDAGV
ncbi:GNAT family N-acetyltransferase [bacterium]|nr:GNAT family N-acetyltransferase [bacterium]